jgi:hypothetical protein
MKADGGNGRQVGSAQPGLDLHRLSMSFAGPDPYLSLSLFVLFQPGL